MWSAKHTTLEMEKKCEISNCWMSRGGAIKLCIISTLLLMLVDYRAIFDTIAERSEAHVLKGCIKNFSIVKIYNKVL